MEKSTHKCEIVPIELLPHPNADTLSVVQIFGYTVCVRTEDWKDKPMGAYVVPDSLVDTRRPEFSFLANPNKADIYSRVKVKKLRGICSQGLLIPAPEGSNIGDDVAQELGILRYEAPETSDGLSTAGEFEKSPFPFGSKYDLDSFYRYGQDVFKEGELLHVREKIDGSSSYYIWEDERIWVASRSGFKKQDTKSIWWIALDKYPEIYSWCQNHQGYRLYGEVFGNNSKMPYGPSKRNIQFRAFDIMNPNGHWLGPLEAEQLSPNIPWAPTVMQNFPYNFDKMIELSNGPSLIVGADHIREGVVVEPYEPKWHYHIGRVKLKIVSNEYLEKKG